MRAVLVVSSHLDDAVLSSGQFLAGRPDAVVATVFAGIPSRKTALTSYDAKCGFDSSREAVEVRRQEDIEALSVLGATHRHLDFLDRQYDTPPGFEAVVASIRDLIDEIDPEFVVGPLGLVHQDHELVRDAVLEAASSREMPVYLCEDLPYRVQQPRAVEQVLNELMERLIDLKLEFIGTGSEAEKLNALWCYLSQMGLPEFENRHELLVSERFWRVYR